MNAHVTPVLDSIALYALGALTGLRPGATITATTTATAGPILGPLGHPGTPDGALALREALGYRS